MSVDVFFMEINITNSAFEDDLAGEIISIFEKIKEDMISKNEFDGNVFDSNGNNVGQYGLG